MATISHDTPRVLVGAGGAGMHVAGRLRRRLQPGEATITAVDPHSREVVSLKVLEHARDEFTAAVE